jgi:acetylglutamate kinase
MHRDFFPRFAPVQDIGLLKHALPYLRRFKDSLFVIKFGGEAIRTEEQLQSLAEDISFLYSVGIKVVVVHGGGAQITAMEEKLGVESRKVGGRRVTSKSSVEVLKMMLSGKLNADLVTRLRSVGVNAVGFSAFSGGTLTATRRPPTKVSGSNEVVDFGEVGDLAASDMTLIRTLLDREFLPVVAPLCADEDGTVLNVNADSVAARLACELKAEKLLLLSDTLGVLTDVNDPTTLISTITPDQVKRAIETGMIKGGMIPKVEQAVEALQKGVRQVHILSGVEPHMLLVEIFTESGCGTMITA